MRAVMQITVLFPQRLHYPHQKVMLALGCMLSYTQQLVGQTNVLPHLLSRKNSILQVNHMGLPHPVTVYGAGP